MALTSASEGDSFPASCACVENRSSSSSVSRSRMHSFARAREHPKALVAPRARILARAPARASRRRRRRRTNDARDGNALANADAHRDARAVPSRAVASNARPRALSRSALGRSASTHQQESGDVFHPCCEVVLKCVRVFVAEEFDSCLSLQRADDSRAHKRRTARGRPARSSPRGPALFARPIIY